METTKNNSTEITPKTILVTGDVAIDYFIVKGKRFYADENNANGTFINQINGGAYLTYEFLKTLSKTVSKDNQLKVTFGYKKNIFNALPEKNKSYVTVIQYEKEKNNIKEYNWRIHEFIGFGGIQNDALNLSDHIIPIPVDTDILIVDDAGMDFAKNLNREVWNSLIDNAIKISSAKPDSIIIYKKSGNFENNDFYNALIKASNDQKFNLLTILSINDIRKLDVKVSSGLSWEQSAIDLAAELRNNDALSPIMNSKFLVVTFHSKGALFIVNNQNDNYEYKLIFNPEKMENDDPTDKQGKMIGNMSYFTAALASNLDLSKKNKYYQIENAIKVGLSAMSLLFDKGFEINDNRDIQFPNLSVAETIHGMTAYPFSSANVPNPDYLSSNQEWSILIDNYSVEQVEKEIQAKAINALAKNIVLKGKDILKNIPYSQFGNLFTIDRSEIESLRNLKKIMTTYIKIDEGKKPLSIGVFGPPGAGKSFAVEEIGKGILGDKYKLLPFNLSQFDEPSDLIGALHQVRDSVLKKETPIVFWDEFDSQKYKWLQYLLAPMQDGLFQEGQITHPVGKCIFIFAGATSYSIEAFGKFKKEDENSKKEDEDSQKDFILKKGPDFISRLNGYINILGPNQRQKFNPDYTTEKDKWIDDPSDINYPIRRAIFIIGILRLKKEDYPFSMDWGLLNALITVGRYKHGSRSLSNLITDIKQNNPRNQLLRSWLPSKSTLELYFENPDDFYNKMIRETDFVEMAWEIAPIIHSFYCKKIKNPTKEYSDDYSFLPVFIKESNVQAAKRIPEVLKAGGFKLVKKDALDKLSKSDFLKLLNLKIENVEYKEYEILEPVSDVLEVMAEKEHSLWMTFYKENGWHHSEIRNDYEKKHTSIIPYDDLPQSEKAKDRIMIANYTDIVDLAGFGIAKI